MKKSDIRDLSPNYFNGVFSRFSNTTSRISLFAFYTGILVSYLTVVINPEWFLGRKKISTALEIRIQVLIDFSIGGIRAFKYKDVVR